jgi:hypothetical protein
MAEKPTYRVIFQNGGKTYEVYARNVHQSGMFGFIEIEQLIFDAKSSVVVDPSEEHLKREFADVNRTYVPMHSVIRIDEVAKEGHAKITDGDGGEQKIAPFPVYTRSGPSSEK